MRLIRVWPLLVAGMVVGRLAWAEPPTGRTNHSDDRPGTPRLRLIERFRGPRPVEAAVVPAPAATPHPIIPRSDAVPRSDAPVRRAQANPGEMGLPLGPGRAPIPPNINLPAAPTLVPGGQSLSLQAALYGALTSNPDLISMRQGNVPGNAASPEAVEVARNFPTTLNPTLWIDVRPLTYGTIPGTNPARLDQKSPLMYFSLRQPIELGHQTRYRHAIAKAAYNQQQWTVVQAELLALVQTYRFFQTAAYRREKLRVAEQLAEFNDRLLQSLRRRLEANQVQAADVELAEVENEATRQLVEVARQDYEMALADLRNQIGAPETAGGTEPLGEFVLPPYIPPADDQSLIQTALRSRPEMHAAHAQADGARAALGLARGDRIPSPVVGPVYERDQDGIQFFGFVYITPIPIMNNGKPLVRQREAEYRRAIVAEQQVEQRTITQVKVALSRWNGANRLVARTAGVAGLVKGEVESLERLFNAGQTDLTKLLQARQRLIQLENARLDSIWAATQAQADLLTALGAPVLIAALQGAPPPDSAPIPPPATTPAPFRPGVDESSARGAVAGGRSRG